MTASKQEMKRAYQQSQRPMGVYQIRCLANDKVLIGSSLNLPGIFNREKFSLQHGGHKNKALQADWNTFGETGFAFEILDELSPRPDPNYDYREDLTVLEEAWLEQVQPYGERGYNEPKKNREQRLQMIAENQRRTALADEADQ